MPTSLERTTVTHTTAVEELLSVARAHWPEAGNARVLVLKLMAEGARSLREQDLEAAYADAYAEWVDADQATVWDQASADGLTEPA
jgi:hypothetical protein